MKCVAMDDKCDGRLCDRPEWCPLTIVEDENENDRETFGFFRKIKS
jgi:hypothetical protein